MKKGLFVGSFNPVTLAHEKIADDLMQILDYLYYLPVNSKKLDLVRIDDRINMISKVLKENQSVLNIYDYSKSGLFDIDILSKINLGITHIVMGSDLFLKFNTFKDYRDILNKYYLIIINRGEEINEYIEDNYQDYKNKIIVINKIYKGSSRLAKEELKINQNNYLNTKVLDYIKKNNLYN